ncbi:hypothetical protein L6452_08509 [Arctium lappa]|uniref:Uncharacterized protein n=1 Tax=Arctium lappa TaxID=4217 RepID=A0ACB9DIB2_ARCLA|nr:hypothetical protein L6452_08509 [Arctium lappa]
MGCDLPRQRPDRERPGLQRPILTSPSRSRPGLRSPVSTGASPPGVDRGQNSRVRPTLWFPGSPDPPNSEWLPVLRRNSTFHPHGYPPMVLPRRFPPNTSSDSTRGTWVEFLATPHAISVCKLLPQHVLG